MADKETKREVILTVESKIVSTRLCVCPLQVLQDGDSENPYAFPERRESVLATFPDFKTRAKGMT